MYQEWINILSSSALFNGIGNDSLSIMLNCLLPKIRKCKRREIIVTYGQPFYGIGIVASGKVALTKETYSGNRIMMGILSKGEIFGEMIAFSDTDAQALQLQGIIGSASPSNATAAIKITGAISDGMGGLSTLNNLNTLFQIQNYTNNPALTILGNGATGIGTTAPGYILDVQHPTSKINSKNGYLTNGADYAEWFKSTDPTLQPGEVVAITHMPITIDSIGVNGITKASVAYDSNLLGVISTNPGFVGNNPFSSEAEEKANNQTGAYKLVALSGQVPVKVSLENGPIEIGDYITSSSIPGGSTTTETRPT